MDWITGELWLWFGDDMTEYLRDADIVLEPITADWCRDFVYQSFDTCGLKEGTALYSIFNHLLWHAGWDEIAERVIAGLEE